MAGLYEIEVEPEMQAWLEPLRPRLRPSRLSRRDPRRTSRDPRRTYARHLGGKVRELRFSLLRQQTRVTYWLVPGRRVVLLTVFAKTCRAETAEVERAQHAQHICEQRHGIAHQTYQREVN